ncbi:MAG: uracil-DNA glycosylase [Lachnospiraceae bacterium]|nr:uracil-DNA glycosylase [Lachnospiraceae bacterium]
MEITWNGIESHIAGCAQCPLSQTRQQPVMGRGNHRADIMLIAEAPGAQEDQQGVPFVGRSGEILDSLLQECGLTREEIYITNILKCHPPGNRDPREEEKEACFPYLKYETFLLKPKIIVCLGRVAAQRIISPDFKITRQHGLWTCRKDCALTATYHPSAILRDPSKYESAKKDFCEIVKKRDEFIPGGHKPGGPTGADF